MLFTLWQAYLLEDHRSFTISCVSTHTHTHCYHTYLTSLADSEEDSEAESDSGALSIARTTVGDGVQPPLSTLCMEGTTVC